MRSFFVAVICLLAGSAYSEVLYSLTPEPGARSVRVSVTGGTGRDQVGFRIPAWCPGFYFLLNYQGKISDVKATTRDGEPLTVRRGQDLRHWVVENPSKGPVTLSYRVLGDDGGLGFFGVSVYPHTAFVNGPAAFMFIEGSLTEPTRLKINNPESWQIATSMSAAGGNVFKARDYDEMIDHPLRLGHFLSRKFQLMGAEFEVVFTSPNEKYRANIDKEVGRFQALSVPALEMFGGAPFKRYVYHVHLAVGSFGGGLEHQASTVLAVGDRDPLGIDDLITHEFFHVWDVKHIRPKPLGPFDYTGPVRTENLWFAEGVDDYYGKLTAYRSGLQGQDYLFSSLAGEIQRYQSGQTRLQKTLAEASWQVWEAGTSQGVGDLSYYNKGQIVGLLLDAAIRSRTNGEKSLDDVMRYLFARHRLPDKPGYEENGILLAINAVAGSDFSDLYGRMVHTTQDLPYEILQEIGLRVAVPGQEALTLGFGAKEGVVDWVVPAVQRQGLAKGDRIIAINGKPIAVGARGISPEGYTISVRRNEEPIRLKLTPVKTSLPTVVFERDPFASAQAAALADQWLARSAK